MIVAAWRNDLLKTVSIGGPLILGLWGFGAVAYRVARSREAADDQIRLLSQEVSHRAKNQLAIVQSIARQTAAESEPEAFAEGFSHRIAGLAAASIFL